MRLIDTVPDVRVSALGSWGRLREQSPQLAEDASWLAGNFIYRDAFKHPDGSRGTVNITAGQLTDLVAFAIQHGTRQEISCP